MLRRSASWWFLALTSLAACASPTETPTDPDPSGSGAGTGGGGSGGGAGGMDPAGTGSGGGSPTQSCNPGDTEACYDGAPEHAGIGACAEGTRTCVEEGEFPAWGECAGWVAPAAESCDGIDNNCDGVVDEGCCVPGPEVCDSADNDCDGAVDEEGCVVSTCKLPFPPPALIPCEVSEPGAVHYVSAAGGSDQNPGTDPAAPWATLAHAISTAPPGSTVRVGPGDYGAADVYLDKPLTLKGGYDPSFTTWDPDTHSSKFSGRLELHNDGAVWAGFRMIAQPVGGGSFSEYFHRVASGSLVRNYVEIVFTGSVDSTFFYGISAAADGGHTSKIQCNDIYMRTEGANLWSNEVIAYGNVALHQGTAVVDANRICYDQGPNAHPGYVIAGYGTCSGNIPATVTITNNVLENARNDLWSTGVEFYGCGDTNLSVRLTNNTIFSHGTGIGGYGASPGDAAVVKWTLVNNIIFSLGGGNSAVNVGSGSGVQIGSSQGNLTFGWGDNGIWPAPLASSGDDTSGAATPSLVFVDPMSGDFHLKPGGPGVGMGQNVYGVAPYGSVTTDLMQAPRPMSGPWDRGAYGN